MCVHRMLTRRRPRPRVRRAQKTKPLAVGARGFEDKSLTMTYFHRRMSTIIGAKAFHCPVRDGKEWDHLAMVVRRSLLPRQILGPAGPIREVAQRLGVMRLFERHYLATHTRSTTLSVIGSSRTGN